MSDLIARLITIIVCVGLNVSIGLTIGEQHATAAGWLAFAVGSLAWVTFLAWLQWPGRRDG